jgi:2-phospho-L-lactate transferase/gluconeogenesis factor (CofD/UPF0052 family)
MSGVRVVALCGGVGGAKLADGLLRTLPPDALGLIVNTGDDFEHLGLHVSPDIDTLLYTLSGLANPATGWGRRDETWSFMQALASLGARPGFASATATSRCTSSARAVWPPASRSAPSSPTSRAAWASRRACCR